MGEMFRSEKMALCQIFLQPEAAFATIAELGEIGCVQFRDLNHGVNAFQRKFVAEVRRCDELERKIRYIENELSKDDIKLPVIYEDIPAAPNPRQIVDLEAQLEKTENEIIELAHNEVNIKTNHLELIELLRVLENTQNFFSTQEVLNLDANHVPNKGEDVHGNHGSLAFVAGVINRERVFAFERMLWRISRGNIFLKRADLTECLKDPRTGHDMYKTVFVVFFQGEQLKTRIKKVCTGFHAHLHLCPSAYIEREEMIKGVRNRIADMQMVLRQTEDHRNCVLGNVAQQLPKWTIMLTKMKAVYHTLNLFNIDVTEKLLIGEGWVPTIDIPTVQQALIDGSAAAGSTLPSFLNVIDTHKEPPTYFRTNKFTRAFQNLIDAYGMATYREVNPALYTCISFPFLFAVMFGDVGHGFILLMIGAWMAIDEKRLGRYRESEIWNIIFAGRYIILLMGIFAIYTGFHYNELFSISINVFGTSWRVRYNTSTVLTNPSLQLDPSVSTQGVYPIGMDPIWQFADNKIIFSNTFKMKISIIFGVLHMTFGVCLSVENFIYFKRYSKIILQFVPQVLFLLCLFGYMCFMMFWKWVKYTPMTDYEPDTPGCAPDVLILFINMMLFKTTPPTAGCGSAYMYAAEVTVERVMVVIAVICIPWLLLGNPLYIQFKRRNQPKRMDELENGKAKHTNDDYDDGHEHNEDDEPMSEIYIHQAIHTVEYLLSTISHTASYLRLWALSLAHSELSFILWSMVMHMGLIYNTYIGAIYLFFIFAIWVFFTISILVIMEGLSAFLHTLRLHWVEFMSKFYEGAGHVFLPFSFKSILEGNPED